jgi:hypothetical protein
VQGLRIAAALAAFLAPAGPASAQPASPSPSDASLGDACRAGLAHERSGALPRAFLELSRCAAPAGDAAAALARVKKKLAAGKYAPVAFSVTPAQAELRIAPFTDGAPLRDPHTLWLPFGTHTYVASAPGHAELRAEVVVDSTARILLQVQLAPLVHARRPRAVDFEAEGPAVDEPIVVADPKPKKLPSLIPKRFRGGLDPEDGSSVRGGRPAGSSGQHAARRSRSWPWILTRGL